MTRPGRWVDPYAGMPGRRLFVATPLPEGASDAVKGIVDAVRAQALPEGAHDVRWVRLDGLHLTLRFLGPTPDDRLGPTLDSVARVAASSPPIEAELGGAGTFPPVGRPRALWIGLVSGGDGLSTLARRLGTELSLAGWPADERPFRAHLTLARSDGISVGRLVADRLVAAMGDGRIPLPIDRIGVFESITGGGPARYVPVVAFDLAGPASGHAVYHPDTP